MDPTPDRDELERLRTRYLRLRAALHDPVTRLPAYPALLSTLRTWLDEHRHVGVVTVGLEDLELVESLYGWQVLDGLVERTAEVLRGAVGDDLPDDAELALDRVAGDRFVLFVRATAEGGDPDGAYLAGRCDRLRLRLDAAFRDDPTFLAIGSRAAFRLGHALLSENPYYRFERRVHGAVAEAAEFHDLKTARRDRSAGEELRRIVEDRDVSTWFLPVVELATRREIGWEALSRGPAGSPLERPASLFAASGRTGFDTALDRVCRDAAFRECGRLAPDGLLFVNVLPRSLDDPEWRGDPVDGLLDEAARSPSRVVVEVSERALDGGADAARRPVDDLRARGFRFALDDVGTGYASIGAMESLRPDYVKVDPTLVRAIGGHPVKQEAMASLVSIAGSLGATVIAEGVESEAEAETLRRLGVPLAQGFLFPRSGPRPGDAR